MLDKLVQLLADNELEIKAPIRDLEASCCPSNKEVYDFDKIKEKYLTSILYKGAYYPKSADALLIQHQENTLLFFEMKDLNHLFDKVKGLSEIEAKTLFDYTFEVDFRPDQKIVDSLILLLDICATLRIDAEFYPFFIHSSCKKKFFFLVNLSARDFVRIGFVTKSLTYKYEYYKLGICEFLPVSNFDRDFP